jgi:hypothetical protein
MRGAAGVQHGSHISNSLQSSIFFLKRKMKQNPCGKCSVGNVIYNEKGRKTEKSVK